MQQILNLVVRHALTASAGVLVTKGYIDEASAEILIGAGVAVAGVGLSILQKKGVVK